MRERPAIEKEAAEPGHEEQRVSRFSAYLPLWLLFSVLLGGCTSSAPPAATPAVSPSAATAEVTTADKERLQRAVGLLEKALTEPGLHHLLKSIEKYEYTPEGLLSVMFSAYGAGFWPPPDKAEGAPPEESMPEGVTVRRGAASGSWQVVVQPEENGFYIAAYAHDLQQPVLEKRLEFKPRG